MQRAYQKLFCPRCDTLATGDSMSLYSVTATHHCCKISVFYFHSGSGKQLTAFLSGHRLSVHRFAPLNIQIYPHWDLVLAKH